MTNGEMIRMREAGFTYKEIGRKASISAATVRSRCQTWGVEPKEKVIRSRNRKPKHDYPRWLIHEMYWICRLSTEEIGYELCMPSMSVRTMMVRLDVPRRSRAEAQRVYVERHPGTRVPPTANREQALRAAMISARKRHRRVASNRRRRELRAMAKVV